MRIFRYIAVSLSLYSKIPVPHFEWKDDDMKYCISFLPLVGVIIGILSFALYFLLYRYTDNLPEIVRLIILSVVPLIVDGGFHVDGYMDCEDAFHSYESKDRKLEILKDPHIGAFSVIQLLICCAFYIAALDLLLANPQDDYFVVYLFGFVISRAVCGISSVKLKHAKKDGMLNTETASVSVLGLGILIAWVIVFAILTFILLPITGIFMIAAYCIFAIYYERKCFKEFGGVTGDTAGYFVTVSELINLICVAVCSYCGIG